MYLFYSAFKLLFPDLDDYQFDREHTDVKDSKENQTKPSESNAGTPFMPTIPFVLTMLNLLQK